MNASKLSLAAGAALALLVSPALAQTVNNCPTPGTTTVNPALQNVTTVTPDGDPIVSDPTFIDDPYQGYSGQRFVGQLTLGTCTETTTTTTTTTEVGPGGSGGRR